MVKHLVHFQRLGPALARNQCFFFRLELMDWNLSILVLIKKQIHSDMGKAKEALGILVQIVVAGLAVIITAYILPGISVPDFLTAIVIAALLALLNLTIKPILIFLTIPITIFTLGLFLLVINAVIVLIAAEIVPGFIVDGFWWAVLFSLILSLINSLLGVSLKG